MKTRLLRRLRRKVIKKIYTIPLEDNGVHFIGITKWYNWFYGGVLLCEEGGWTCDREFAQRYFDEDECIESLKRVRRTYIYKLIDEIKTRKKCQKINRLKQI